MVFKLAAERDSTSMPFKVSYFVYTYVKYEHPVKYCGGMFPLFEK